MQKQDTCLGTLGEILITLLFLDDLKLCSKTMQELDCLVQTVWIFSSDVGMQFGIFKCAILEMKRGKVVHSERIELPNG